MVGAFGHGPPFSESMKNSVSLSILSGFIFSLSWPKSAYHSNDILQIFPDFICATFICLSFSVLFWPHSYLLTLTLRLLSSLSLPPVLWQCSALALTTIQTAPSVPHSTDLWLPWICCSILHCFAVHLSLHRPLHRWETDRDGGLEQVLVKSGSVLNHSSLSAYPYPTPPLLCTH